MDNTKMQALEGLVSEVDGNSPEAQAQAAEEAAQATTAEAQALAWSMIPRTVGKLACMIAPELAPVYTDDACREWGEAMQPVAEKYGWGGPGALPELNLAIASAAMAVPTFFVLKIKLAAMRKAHEDAKPIDGEGIVTAAQSPAQEGSGNGG